MTEVLQTFSKKLHERLWEGLKALCNNQIVNATPSADTEEDDAIHDEVQTTEIINQISC